MDQFVFVATIECDAQRQRVECGQANTLWRGERVDARSHGERLMSCTASQHRECHQMEISISAKNEWTNLCLAQQYKK